METIPEPLKTVAACALVKGDASVWSLSFSHDGKLMAAVAGDRTISLWDVTNLNSIRLLQQVGVGAEMWGVPFSPDDKIMATGGLDRHVRLWNVPDIKPVGAFPPSADHRGLVQSVDFDPRGEWIATASVDHTVQLWNVRTQEVVSLGGHNRPVWWVEFSRDGQWLVSGGLDHRVVVRNLAAIKRVLKVDPVDLLKEAHRHTCLDLVHNEPKYYDDCKQ
jgi:WD40 repeat protein